MNFTESSQDCWSLLIHHGLVRGLSVPNVNGQDGTYEISRNYSRIWPLVSLGSNNGLAFTAKLSHGSPRLLNINWKLRCMYHPGRGREDEKNITGDFKLNLLLKLVVTWLTSCLTPFSESDVPQTETS